MACYYLKVIVKKLINLISPNFKHVYPLNTSAQTSSGPKFSTTSLVRPVFFLPSSSFFSSLVFPHHLPGTKIHVHEHVFVHAQPSCSTTPPVIPANLDRSPHSFQRPRSPRTVLFEKNKFLTIARNEQILVVRQTPTVLTAICP